jgi:hypothetical protein
MSAAFGRSAVAQDLVRILTNFAPGQAPARVLGGRRHRRRQGLRPGYPRWGGRTACPIDLC